jgi:hypothetical protein
MDTFPIPPPDIPPPFVASINMISTTISATPCWVCVIFFARVVASPCWVCVIFFLGKHVTYLGVFSVDGFFADGFLFLVKELGLLTNPGHWVRVLDATGSYMYIVL